LSKPAQYVRKEQIKQTISVGDFTLFLSKHTAFLVCQIAQITTAIQQRTDCGFGEESYESRTSTVPYCSAYRQTLKNKPAGSKHIWLLGTQKISVDCFHSQYKKHRTYFPSIYAFETPAT
jgi:hypothetical protein